VLRRVYFASCKDRKPLAAVLKPVYAAPSPAAAAEQLVGFSRGPWRGNAPRLRSPTAIALPRARRKMLQRLALRIGHSSQATTATVGKSHPRLTHA